MRGIWSQVVTLAVIVQIALVSGKSLIQQNQQTQQQLEQKTLSENAAEKRVGYDYPAPPDNLVNPFQDQDDLHLHGDHHDAVDHHDDHHDHFNEHHEHEHHEEHHVVDHHDEHHDHHDHHDPGYWKKKIIWKPGFKKIWKPSRKQIWKSSWKKIFKPIWVPTKIPVYKDIQVKDWKKIYKPEWIKVGVPGEKYLGKDHDGWEYTSHDLWKKKLVWRPLWKKYYKPAKKLIWIPHKKLVWKESYKQIWIPDWQPIWVPGVKKIWRPVVISEWFPSPDHHHEYVHESHGWDRSDNSTAASQKTVIKSPIPERTAPTQSKQSSWQFPK